MLISLDLSKRFLDETSIFVREPVIDVCKKIKEDSRIILGGRGSGKTVILNYLEGKNIDSKDKFVCMKFDAAGIERLFDAEEEVKIINKNRYEVMFCEQLFSYIRSYYKLTYDKYFSDKYDEIHSLSRKIIEYLNNYLYVDANFEDYVNTGDLVVPLVEDFKKYLEVDKLSLGLDRFDHIENSNANVQKILSEYFKLFDQVIITSDDEDIKGRIPSGYKYIEPLYNKDLDIIKEIILRRISSYNSKSNNKKFDESFITKEICETLIEKTNGNIRVMLYIISGMIDELCFDDYDDLNKVFQRQCEEKVEQNKRVMEIGKKPEFHL